MIILASASTARRRMMEQAGVALTVDVAAVDEDAVKQGLRQETANPARAAETLAELKAVRVSARHPGQLVIGADQILDYSGTWFDKPRSLEEARTHLLTLRHRTHRLTSAVVAVRDGQRLWYHTEPALMTMRNFSDVFLDDYLTALGDSVLSAVGAYHLEGLGAQLFLQVEGDFFTVLGLPLLPLLDFLRENGELRP
ncbi:conserved hypothetical protein [Candidatus Terasakiella magnetica]|nr:conserved hypothetical protein [Candidatus Terasakiella magnetica]